MTNISVLGLGAMGSAIASTLVSNGHEVMVWNRSSRKIQKLISDGAQGATTARDAVAKTDIVIICVVDDTAAQTVLFDEAANLTGKAIINLTNGTPAQAREFADRVRAAGGNYLDGGIMAVPAMIGGPDAFILYSGDRTVYEAHSEMLSMLGAAQYLGEDAGLASLHDLALLAAMYGLFAGAFHSFAMVRSEGIEVRDFLPLLQPWLAAMADALPEMAHQVDSGNYSEDVASNLDMQTKSMDNILATSRALGVSPALMEPMRDLMQERVNAGFAGDDLASVAELLSRRKT